jgi:hypothetical protein
MMGSGGTIIVRAIVAPIVFAVVSLIYFKKFNYTTPLLTAALFTGFVVVVDLLFFVVVDIFYLGLQISRSLETYARWVRPWIPFALIFGSTYLTGLLTTGSSNSKAHKVAVVVVCAITSALGSGVFGFFIDVGGWGMYENALFGAYNGFGVGLVVGISWSIYLLVKRYASWKVIRNTLFMALLISGLFVVVYTLYIFGPPR